MNKHRPLKIRRYKHYDCEKEYPVTERCEIDGQRLSLAGQDTSSNVIKLLSYGNLLVPLCISTFFFNSQNEPSKLFNVFQVKSPSIITFFVFV